MTELTRVDEFLTSLLTNCAPLDSFDMSLLDAHGATLAADIYAGERLVMRAGSRIRSTQIGLAASIGAGISMGLTEAVSDDGVISGRGSPVKRGLACGIMTAVGGLGHALPYLIPHFWTATIIAMIVVFFELWAIVWIQNKYMEAPFFRAALQVVVGGALVLAAGILIGTG